MAIKIKGTTVIDDSRNFIGAGSNITSLTAGNLTGTIPSTVLGNSTIYVGTTALALNRASAALSLTGISIDGSASQVVATVSGTNSAELVRGNMADSDQFRILVGGTATNAGYVELATADDGTEPIYIRQYTGTFATLTRTATLLDGSGNTSFPGTVTAPTFSGALSGNASTASTWQTARTLTIGGTGKSVSGGANVSWSLAEIGVPSTTGSGASGTWGINISGTAATATNVAASGITGQTGMWTSTARPGPYRLYRNDSNDAHNIQVTWQADKSNHWSLRGYDNDILHAPCYVAYSGYADSAGTSSSCSGNAATVTNGVYTTGATMSGLLATKTNDVTFVNANDRTLSVRGNASYGAVMSFHRTDAYAVNFGLDTDNAMKLGGWTASTIKHTWTLNGNYYATGSISAFYSDERLKTKIGYISNAVNKVCSLNAFYYANNELAQSFGYNDTKQQVGLSAQEVKKVLPEVVSLAPFDMKTDEFSGKITSKSGEYYLTIDYAKIVPLLIEAIKEQQNQINQLKNLINK